VACLTHQVLKLRRKKVSWFSNEHMRTGIKRDFDGVKCGKNRESYEWTVFVKNRGI